MQFSITNWTRTETVEGTTTLIQFSGYTPWTAWTHPNYMIGAGTSFSYSYSAIPPPNSYLGGAYASGYRLDGYAIQTGWPYPSVRVFGRSISVSMRTSLGRGCFTTFPDDLDERNYMLGGKNFLLSSAGLVFPTKGEPVEVAPHPMGRRENNIIANPVAQLRSYGAVVIAPTTAMYKPRSATTVELLHPWNAIDWPVHTANCVIWASRSGLGPPLANPPPDISATIYPRRRCLIKRYDSSAKSSATLAFVVVRGTSGIPVTFSFQWYGQDAYNGMWLSVRQIALPVAAVTSFVWPSYFNSMDIEPEFLAWAGPAVWGEVDPYDGTVSTGGFVYETPFWHQAALTTDDAWHVTGISGMPPYYIGWFFRDGVPFPDDPVITNREAHLWVPYASFDPPVILSLHA